MGCLTKIAVNKFLRSLKSGAINPEKLAGMTSEQRRASLAKIVGDKDAKWVNTEFESKLLLKNQKQGMITWAKKVGGLKEEARRDIISKIEKLEKPLSEKDEGAFLEDIVERRLGVKVTQEEANKIIDLTNDVKKHEKGTKGYGESKQKLVSYMRDVAPVEKLKPVADMVSFFRGIITGFDFSAALRQGASYFGTKQWNSAFKNMFKYAKSQEALDGLEAEIYGSKYADELIKVKRELGLTILGESFTQREEEFASRFIKKVPYLEGSARAYEGFLNDLRLNRFVDIMDNLDKAGAGISENVDAMKDLAKVIGSATGRGQLGSLEGAARPLGSALFSPRWLASRFQIILNPARFSGKARTEAITALARLMGVGLSVASLAKMSGADVEDDPRSSDFAKPKFGNTRFDFFGGMTPVIVLLTRLARSEVKSTITGKVSKLNTGKYGDRTKWSLIGDFISNKVSPVAGVVRDFMKGETFDGEPLNLQQPPKKLLEYFANQFVTPLFLREPYEAFKEASGDNKLLLGTLAGAASMFGISTSSYQYTPSGKNWDLLKEKRPELYKKKVERARTDFKKAMFKIQNSDRFQALPETGDELSQAKIIDKTKRMISKRHVGNPIRGKR